MEKLEVIEPKKRKSGIETFNFDTEVKISEFWKWAYSSLLTNVVRGVVAEFLVAHKLGIAKTEKDFRKEEWDPYDLDYRDKRIEIKSASFIQTWKQEKCSDIKFNIAKKKSWDRKTNEWSDTKQRNCNIYVFCLLAEKCEPDPMNVQHWDFYVVDADIFNKDKNPDKKTISLAGLKKLAKNDEAKKVSYGKLRDAVNRLVESS